MTAVAAVTALPVGLPSLPLGSPKPPPPQQSGGQLFASTSFWNAPLPSNAAVDVDSTRLVSALAAEIARETAAQTGPWIQTSESSTPLYTVAKDQPNVRVRLDVPDRPWNATLRSALSAVPIPPGAQPSAGTDHHLTVWQPSTDRLWELWRGRHALDGWHAEWGGAIEHASQNIGYYDPSAWPGGQYNWGATASSLPVIGGTMLESELAAGHIDHALALDVADARSGVFAWPAQRSDGSGGLDDLPEGARLRIDPSLDLSSLRLTPMARMMAEAAQRYGIVVRDRTGHATAFFAQDMATTGTDPYHGAGGFFGGKTPIEVLAGFPWSRLEVLKMSLCATAPCLRGGSP